MTVAHTHSTQLHQGVVASHDTTSRDGNVASPWPLAPLQPLQVSPSDFSARTRVVLALRHVEFFAVEATKGNTCSYTIQVFHKSAQHHIPLREYSNGRAVVTHAQWRTTSQRPAALREPYTVVERSLAQLANLHNDLFQLARTGHGLEPCAFCLSVISYCGYSPVKPSRSTAWLHGADSVCERLAQYLNELLEIVAKVKAFHPDGCTGQERIPIRLERFLQLKPLPSPARRSRASIA